MKEINSADKVTLIPTCSFHFLCNAFFDLDKVIEDNKTR